MHVPTHVCYDVLTCALACKCMRSPLTVCPASAALQVMEVAGDVAVKALAAVNDEVVPFFSKAAQELIAGMYTCIRTT